MGGFLKKFAPMMGAFLGHPSTCYGYLFRNFTSTWDKKWPFSFKITQFWPIMGGFYANFAPMMGAFFMICVMGCTSVAISQASTPLPSGVNLEPRGLQQGV